MLFAVWFQCCRCKIQVNGSHVNLFPCVISFLVNLSDADVHSISQQLLRPLLFLSLSENKTTPVGDPLNTHDHESLPQVSWDWYHDPPWYHSIFQHRLGVSDLRHHLEATTAYSRPGLSSRACGKLGDSKKLPNFGSFLNDKMKLWMKIWWRLCCVCVCTKLSWIVLASF